MDKFLVVMARRRSTDRLREFIEKGNVVSSTWQFVREIQRKNDGNKDMAMADFFIRGGPLMYVIAAAGLVALASFIDRWLGLRPEKIVPAELLKNVTEAALADDAKRALSLCHDDSSAIASVLSAVIEHRFAPLELVKEKAVEAGTREAAALERRVKWVGTVASVSPMLGFLGSVTGMMTVFQRVTETGKGGAVAMAPGIWESLTTTSFGLMVGIPALVGHRILLSKLDVLILKMEEEAMRILDIFHPTKEIHDVERLDRTLKKEAREIDEGNNELRDNDEADLLS